MIKFDHNCRTLNESMGISTRRADILTANMMFEQIATQRMLHQLYDDPETAPRNMTTKTGMLERALEEAKSTEEMAYVVWEYAKWDVLEKTDERFKAAHMMTSMMLYMNSGSDKDKFINLYLKHKAEAESEMDGEDK